MPEIKLTGINLIEMNKAVADHRAILLMNGHVPNPQDSRNAIAQAQLESAEREANLRLKKILKKLKSDLESDSLGLTLEWDNIWQKYIGE